MQHQSPTSSADYAALIQQAPQLQPYYLTTLAPSGEQVHVALSNSSTWRKFSRQNTEMIVTKVGRRMFPTLSLDIQGLDPAKKYEVYVTLMLADRHTLKYQRGVWLPNGQGEVYPPPGCTVGLAYVHPDSPAPGKHWTRQEVAFMRLKLTNKLDCFANEPARNGTMIFAYSMHKYLPVVHIRELSRNATAFYTAVTFPGTEFITVTAYQNPELTDLKIQFNPYAKGIRNQGDRSGPLLIDSFRPTVQALQQQLQLPSCQPRQDVREPDIVEFGSYPEQTDSAYGYWSQQQQQSHRSRRLYRPYSAVEASPTVLAASSTIPSSEVDSSSSAACAYTPSPYQASYQPHYQPHHQQFYYQPAYNYHLVDVAQMGDAQYEASGHSNEQQLSPYFHHHLQGAGATVPLPLLSTPLQQQQQPPQQQQHVQPPQQQSCPTDSSSLSTVSFSSPPTCDL
ncbi:hypothetical protein BOX15_Mlig018453g1 [Macrostomum lignano]|uniref:T-box domain-containing protein n=2 Tax=Macrostomum lignano TaxID=282301 RepID=A0A1I8HEV0_9PLAT|nr:hypothetical protein BOX15_Mlig018453g1 [Macrostomum lignano]